MASLSCTIQINPSEMDLVINLVKAVADNYDELPLSVQHAANQLIESKSELKTPYESAIEYTDVLEKVRR